MKIYLSPQDNHTNDKIQYSFEGEKITATYLNITDTFDFTGLTEGVMANVETDLPVNPIISAERRADGLYVQLLNFISMDATEEEKFPEWTEV